MGLYAADGSINVTVVDGSSYTGLYAADGSYNVVVQDGTAYTGLMNPCGAYNVVVSSSDSNRYSPSGAYNVSESPYVEGTMKVTAPGGGLQPIPRNDLFGVNMSGPEFSPWNGQTFPIASDWTYLKNKGVGYVRLPIAWESLQHTLGGALDSTYLTAIEDSIDAAYAQGIETIVGIHNFAHYADQTRWNSSVGYAGNVGTTTTGVVGFGDGSLTSAHFTDVWTKLSTALVGRPGLKGYGIMNEPINVVGGNLLTTPNFLTGSDWFAINASVRTQLAAGTNPANVGYSPAWSVSSGTGFGGAAHTFTFLNVPYTLSAYIRSTSGTPNAYMNIAASSTNKALTTSWVRHSVTATPAAGSSNIVIGVGAAAGTTIQVANVQLELGSSMTTYKPNPWLTYAQDAITAIRLIDAVTPIYVCGNNFGQGSTWVANNDEMSALTGSGIIFEAHQYFDGAQGVGGGGAYSGTFTSFSIDTDSGADCISPFISWCASKGVEGYVGEFGVPNNTSDNNAQWLPLQVNFLEACRTATIPATQWFYGNNGIQPSNNLNIGATVDDERLIQMLEV